MDNPKQNNGREKVLAQRYCVVTIPHAVPGYTTTQYTSKGQGQSK